MVKVCDTVICKTPKTIFGNCEKSGKFPYEQKKTSAVQFTRTKHTVKG